MPKETATSSLREINQLIRDLDVIIEDCGSENAAKNKAKAKLDDFQSCKIDLADLLTAIKGDIKTLQGLQERLGEKTQETIRLKYKVESAFETAKKTLAKMDDSVKKDRARMEAGKKDALSEDDIKTREDLTVLMKQDLEYTQAQFRPKTQESSSGFQIARQAREKRQKKREDGTMASEPIPLTVAQQQFIQQSIERDKVFEEKLDEIKKGVVQLGMMADDINQELDKQMDMLGTVEEKINKATDNLVNRNAQMKKLLEDSGGAQRWCPLLFLAILLLGLLGYIYNAFLK